MHEHPALRRVILSVAIGLVASARALGQQKYRLHATAAVGDTCTVDSSIDTSFMVTVNVPTSGQGDQQIPFSERERESYSEKVLAVDQKGPAAIRRTYTIARTVTTDASLNETTKVSSLQGKTVTIRRVGDQVTVTAEPGKLSSEDEKALASELSHSVEEFFPDRDMTAGEEWPIDPHLMLAFFPGMEKADAHYRFQQVLPHAGHSCAQIHVNVQVQGTAPGTTFPMTIKLDGNLYRALDLKRTLSDDETGPATFEGEQQQNGVTMHVSGQGTMHVTETHRWLQVNGKPVKASG